MAAQADEHARLDGGANAEASYDTYLNAAVEALVASGASADAVVLASAAAGAAANRALLTGRLPGPGWSSPEETPT